MTLASPNPITEVRHAWGFLVWDPSDGIVTREQIVMAEGDGTETAGLVLGRIGVCAATAGGGNTGNGVFGTITQLPGAPDGNYVATCTQATSGAGEASTQAHEGNVGTSTFGAITVGPAAELGAYRLELTATGAAAAFDVFTPQGELAAAGHIGTAFNAGGLGFTLTAGGDPTAGDSYDIIVSDDGVALFSLTDPFGRALPPVTVGAAYSSGLDFTLSQGTVKFAVGDTFMIAASAANAQYAAWDPTQTNGLQYVAGILGSYRANTSAMTVNAGALVRGPARVNSSELLLGANVTTAAQVASALAQLSALGIQSTPGTIPLAP
jgi:Bacteriophage lambda head decoration protein D